MAPCTSAGRMAADPWARLAHSVQPPMARNANATWTAVARASLARDKLGLVMGAPPSLSIEIIPGWSLPPLSLALVWGMGAVLALLTAGALAAVALPRLRPGQ